MSLTPFQKTINPFSKSKPTPEVKEDNPSSVFDSMAKPEIKKTTNGKSAYFSNFIPLFPRRYAQTRYA